MKNLKIKERPSKMVSLRIPNDTLKNLKTVADSKGLGYQSLLKLYIGEGLRKDLADLNKSSLLSETESILNEKLGNKKQVDEILDKLKRIDL